MVIHGLGVLAWDTDLDVLSKRHDHSLEGVIKFRVDVGDTGDD